MVTARLGASLSSTLKTLLFVGPFSGLHASGYTTGGSNVLSVITWSPPHHPEGHQTSIAKTMPRRRGGILRTNSGLCFICWKPLPSSLPGDQEASESEEMKQSQNPQGQRAWALPLSNGPTCPSPCLPAGRRPGWKPRMSGVSGGRQARAAPPPAPGNSQEHLVGSVPFGFERRTQLATVPQNPDSALPKCHENFS